MQTKNSVSVGRFLESKKQNSFETSSYLNLPDLQFFHWCNQQYRLNRGVYNAIDQWFFEYGIINIQFRRVQILAFLEFVSEEFKDQESFTFIRFGHGGLSKKLNEFIFESGKGKVIPLKSE
jgi:riboflavin kinase